MRVEPRDERCKSRVAGVRKIVDSFRFSLHPYDFSPSTADVCWIPNVREAILDGTDEEWQRCEADLPARIPELSAAWLEKRRKVFLGLLPHGSPNPEDLSLVTTLFDCTECSEFGMRIESAISHSCRYDIGDKARSSGVDSARSLWKYTGTPWNSGLAKYRYSAELSAIARQIVLECGENPDTITIQEMNGSNHRFVRNEGDRMAYIINWVEAVSSVARLFDYPMSDLGSRRQFEHRRYRRSRLCRILRSDEFPEYEPQPENQRCAWCCLHCWRAGTTEWRRRTLGDIKDHLAQS